MFEVFEENRLPAARTAECMGTFISDEFKGLACLRSLLSVYRVLHILCFYRAHMCPYVTLKNALLLKNS